MNSRSKSDQQSDQDMIYTAQNEIRIKNKP